MSSGTNTFQNCTHLAVYSVYEQETGQWTTAQVQPDNQWDLSLLHPTTGGTIGLRRIPNAVLVDQLAAILKERNPKTEFEKKAFRKSLTKHIGLRKDQATFVSHVPIVDGLSLAVDIVQLAPSLCSITADNTRVSVSSDRFRYDPVVFETSLHPTIVPVKSLRRNITWKNASFRVPGQTEKLSAAGTICHFVTQIEEWAANPRRQAEVSVDYTRFATEGDEGTAFRLTFECPDAKGLPRITTVKDLLCD